MNTATQLSTTSLFEQIDAFRLEAEQLGAEAHDLFSQYQAKVAERQQALLKMAEAATQAANENGTAAPNLPVRAAAVPAKPKAAAVPAKGRAAAVPAKPKSKPAPAAGGRMYGQEVSLKKTIWNILSRSNSINRKFCPDIPTTAVGLKIGEINTIIKSEGVWKSSAENITSQIQGHLYKLRDENQVIARDEETRRYYAIEGATFE